MFSDDAVAHQDEGNVQDKRGRADGKSPEMIGNKGKSGKTARSKVCKLCKCVDADRKKDIADNIAYSVQAYVAGVLI